GVEFISHDPAVVGRGVAVGGPRDVNQAVLHGEAGALVGAQRIELHHIAGGGDAGARNLGSNFDRTSELLLASSDVESVQTLDGTVPFFRLGDQVKRVRSSVNDG